MRLCYYYTPVDTFVRFIVLLVDFARCFISFLEEYKFYNLIIPYTLLYFHYIVWYDCLDIGSQMWPIGPCDMSRMLSEKADLHGNTSTRCSSNSEDLCAQISRQANKKIRTDSPTPSDVVWYWLTWKIIRNVHENIEHTFFCEKCNVHLCVWLQEEIVLLIFVFWDNDECLHSTAREEYFILLFMYQVFVCIL